jgi:hypothetical protein
MQATVNATSSDATGGDATNGALRASNQLSA